MKIKDITREAHNNIGDHESLMWTLITFCDWLHGMAMNLVNDEGERFSPKPFYEAIRTIARLAPKKRLREVTALYRGASLLTPPQQTTGLMKVSNKSLTSWSGSLKEAHDFAIEQNGLALHGKRGYPVVFYARADANRERLVLSVHDAYTWFLTIEPMLQASTAPKVRQMVESNMLSDISRDMENYAGQDEIILRGTQAIVDKVEVQSRVKR